MFMVIGLNEVIQLGSPVWARKYKGSEASTCLMSYKKSKASTVGVRKHREDVQGPSLERCQHLEVKRRRETQEGREGVASEVRRKPECESPKQCK